MAQSEKGQLVIHLLVCVQTLKALINHQGGVGVQGGAPSGLRMPYKAVCMTHRGAEGWRGCGGVGVKDEGMAEHKEHRTEKAWQEGAPRLNAGT